MFGFLKKKLKNVVDKFSKKVDEEAVETKEVVEEIKEEIVEEKVKKEPVKVEKKKKVEEPVKEIKEKKISVPEEKIEEAEVKGPVEEKKEIKEPIKEKKISVSETIKEIPVKKVEEIIEQREEFKPVEKVTQEKTVKEVEVKEEISIPEVKDSETKPEIKETAKDVKEEKRGFFGKIKHALTTKKIDEIKFDELFWDLELALLENNTAYEVIEKIKNDLKKNIVDTPLPKGKIDEIIISSLRDSMEELFVKNFDLVEHIKNSEKKPFVICFVGINGSGKTTSIAKVANHLKKNGFSVVLAAADTFRAAAIDQIQLHANNLGIKLIKHDYGSDPAAVAFDAIKHAESAGKDVVLIDTAGRIHSNTNLMSELSKIIRVAKPDLKIFVGESITGNDCVEQAVKFNDAVDIDGIILSKADVDDKGGAAISVSYITKKPILYLGMGQEYDDLELFKKEKIIENIGL